MKMHVRESAHSAAYWLRKAVRARANAQMYPDYRDALESLAGIVRANGGTSGGTSQSVVQLGWLPTDLIAELLMGLGA